MHAAGFRLRAACGIAGPVAFTAAWVTSTLRQTGYSVAEEHLSGLAAPDARDPEILLAGFLALGACTTAFGSALREALGGPGRAPTVECGGTAPEAASGNGVGGRGSRVLRSMQVRTQLLAMLVLPLLALTVLSGARVNTAVTEGQSAEQARALAGFAVQTNLLVTELQQERGQSSDYLASDRRRGRGALAAQREAVGQVLTAFRAAADRCRWPTPVRGCDSGSATLWPGWAGWTSSAGRSTTAPSRWTRRCGSTPTRSTDCWT